jgi:hypothetical protein
MAKVAKRCVSGKTCCGGLHWVQCDRCDRYELYENCGLDGEYVEEKVQTLKFVCRLCGVEERQAVTDGCMNEWKSDMNARMTELEEWKNGVSVRVSALEE